MYITKQDIQKTLASMVDFYGGLKQHFDNFDMNLESNLGRRNIFMSMVQEEFLARSLQEKYKSVISDGAPGMPDVYIGDINKEIECKLTTVNKSGSISFQSDYETLLQKGSLDYLYFIASPDFDKFTVLLFEGLTVDDFRPLSPGSRGKVAMKKHAGMKKCTVLWGDVIHKNEIEIQKIDGLTQAARDKFDTITEQVTAKAKSVTAPTQLDKLSARIDREHTIMRNKMDRLLKRKQYWLTDPGKYSFDLQNVV